MILLAGVAAGALNALGGGGSFVALSALVATGMPPVTANATTTALDPARGNPLRVIQVAAVYLTATVIFLFAADVLDQPIRLVALLIGAIVGGYAGAHLVRRLPASLLKTLVLTTAVAMTALFFVRAAR